MLRWDSFVTRPETILSSEWAFWSLEVSLEEAIDPVSAEPEVEPLDMAPLDDGEPLCAVPAVDSSEAPGVGVWFVSFPWVPVVVSALSLLANASSRSEPERRTWVPVAIVMLVSSVAVVLLTA
jgi:hypothetical protein